LLWVLIVTL